MTATTPAATASAAPGGETAPSPEQPWMNAGRNVWWAWNRLSHAQNLLDQADATVALANAMSDLGSYLPEYDAESGELHDDDAPAT